MRKVIFYTSAVAAVLLLLNILNILLFDIGRLTDYGYGYLAGKFLLFLLFTGSVYLSRTGKVKAKR